MQLSTQFLVSQNYNRKLFFVSTKIGERNLSRLVFFVSYFDLIISLTHFIPVLHCYTPENIRKPKGFLVFSGGKAMQNWAETG